MFSKSKLPLVSIIIPALNEEENISTLHKELTQVCAPLPYQFEFIVIDNCSTDKTGFLLKEICRNDFNWKYIRFSRTFLPEASLAAGYHMACGEALITIFSDLQEPPSLIPDMLEKWQQGYDVVYGVHTQREGDGFILSLMAKLAYRLIKWSSDGMIPADASDFRLISRRVKNALDEIGETCRYTRGIIPWLGFKQTGIKYQRRKRQAGKSKTDLGVYLTYLSNGVTTYSLKPLRLFLLFGFVLTLISMTGILCLPVLIFMGYKVTVELAVIFALIAATAINSLGIGLLGEYLGRVYLETKQRPLYILDEVVNFTTDKKEENPNFFGLHLSSSVKTN